MIDKKEEVLYKEAYTILETLGDNYINKLPKDLYEFIRNESEKYDRFILDKTKKISNQISEDTIAFIAYLNLNYWCTENEKNELIKIYKENDLKEEEKKKEKYNIDNIFENNLNKNVSEKEITLEDSKTTNELIKYEEEKWYKKLFEKVSILIKKILRKK